MATFGRYWATLKYKIWSHWVTIEYSPTYWSFFALRGQSFGDSPGNWFGCVWIESGSKIWRVLVKSIEEISWLICSSQKSCEKMMRHFSISFACKNDVWECQALDSKAHAHNMRLTREGAVWKIRTFSIFCGNSTVWRSRTNKMQLVWMSLKWECHLCACKIISAKNLNVKASLRLERKWELRISAYDLNDNVSFKTCTRI